MKIDQSKFLLVEKFISLENEDMQMITRSSKFLSVEKFLSLWNKDMQQITRWEWSDLRIHNLGMPNFEDL